jgi:hypothetical protein
MVKKHKSMAKRAATPKKTAKKGKRAYSSQTGRLSGREVNAQVRLDALTEQYVSEGMDPASARSRARAVMRDNPRKDWRVG